MKDTEDKRIPVIEDSGIFRVPAEFETGFHLVPDPHGSLHLFFCDQSRMTDFLADFGYLPTIRQGTN